MGKKVIQSVIDVEPKSVILVERYILIMHIISSIFGILSLKTA